MYDGYLALDGAELVNNERYAALAATLGLPVPRKRCTTLRQVLADDPYTTANAPWADPGLAEAADFAGFYVSSITGLGSATAARDVADGIDGGGIPGRLRSGPRTMLVTAFTAARSPAALTYGLQWLRAVLYDECADGCGGATLCGLAECPSCDVDTGPHADACWEASVRTLHQVVCVSGPTMSDRRSVARCAPGAVAATVEFTLVAAQPHIYRSPAVLATALTFTDPAPSADCQVTWLPVGPGRGTCPTGDPCGPPPSLLTDPAAPALPALPTVPVHSAAGACLTRLRSSHAIASSDPALIPRWLDSVPVVTVRAGDADLRRLTLTFHANPRGLTITDPAQLDPCAALAELNLAYLPRDTELVIDGRSRTAYVRGPGGRTEPAGSVLAGPAGAPWTWPALSCGVPLTALALVSADDHSAAATIDVALAPRQDIA